MNSPRIRLDSLTLLFNQPLVESSVEGIVRFIDEISAKYANPDLDIAIITALVLGWQGGTEEQRVRIATTLDQLVGQIAPPDFVRESDSSS